MSLLGGLLELVEVREGANDGLHAELVRKAFGLLRRADVEGEFELLEEAGGGKNLAKESAANIAWLTPQ